MTNTLLTLLLSLQLAVCAPHAPAPQSLALSPQAEARSQPLWWGLIDPELSLWFAHIPQEESTDEPILWDWSWRGFLAALFGQPMAKEGLPHASEV